MILIVGNVMAKVTMNVLPVMGKNRLRVKSVMEEECLGIAISAIVRGRWTVRCAKVQVRIIPIVRYAVVMDILRRQDWLIVKNVLVKALRDIILMAIK